MELADFARPWAPISQRFAPDRFTTPSIGSRSRIWCRSPLFPQPFATNWLREPCHGACRRSSAVYESVDGTRRYLLRLEDGRTVETVLMPEGERDTICISSQVGCPVDCKFCMTALMGLERNLTAGEIVGQVLLVARENQLRRDGGPAEHRDDGAGRAAAESGRT